MPIAAMSEDSDKSASESSRQIDPEPQKQSTGVYRSHNSFLFCRYQSVIVESEINNPPLKDVEQISRCLFGGKYKRMCSTSDYTGYNAQGCWRGSQASMLCPPPSPPLFLFFLSNKIKLEQTLSKKGYILVILQLQEATYPQSSASATSAVHRVSCVSRGRQSHDGWFDSGRRPRSAFTSPDPPSCHVSKSYLVGVLWASIDIYKVPFVFSI